MAIDCPLIDTLFCLPPLILTPTLHSLTLPPSQGATGTLLGAPEEAALLCFMSHGHVFPEMWSQGLTRP